MACFGFASFASCCVLVSLIQQTVAPPSPIIEAYKPTTVEPTTGFQEGNQGFGGLDNLRTMLTRLEHKIDDFNMRRRFMEAQMKAPNGLFASRMEAALDYTNPGTPSTVYHNQKIVSVNGMFLQIFPDGTANGTRDDTSPYTSLSVEMVGVGETVKIMIKGEKSKKYLTCTKNGKKFHAMTKKSSNGVFLIPQPPKPKDTRKITQRSLYWNTKKYMNLKCEKYGWFLAFRHNAQLKKGRRSSGRKLDSWFMLLSGV
ncbi:uncharacterized protein LOC114524463 [Dendronephthya gigantea]|uniref:uncharacterized protein LOC114524463 n=1 Tax=Dendronephthya gigantea TaxID=151771 RepID=UPI00106BC6FB|nr:uncharacterized protein LOC114524463 [Dendronephthya gigantea]